jgi:hypothetical protein
MAANTTQKKQSSNQGLWKFLNGGLSGMAATCVVQPIDLIKNRMQLAGEGKGAKLYANSFDAAVSIFKAEGVSGMYAGYVENEEKKIIVRFFFRLEIGFCCLVDLSLPSTIFRFFMVWLFVDLLVWL